MKKERVKQEKKRKGKRKNIVSRSRITARGIAAEYADEK